MGNLDFTRSYTKDEMARAVTLKRIDELSPIVKSMDDEFYNATMFALLPCRGIDQEWDLTAALCGYPL